MWPGLLCSHPTPMLQHIEVAPRGSEAPMSEWREPGGGLLTTHAGVQGGGFRGHRGLSGPQPNSAAHDRNWQGLECWSPASSGCFLEGWAVIPALQSLVLSRTGRPCIRLLTGPSADPGCAAKPVLRRVRERKPAFHFKVQRGCSRPQHLCPLKCWRAIDLLDDKAEGAQRQAPLPGRRRQRGGGRQGPPARPPSPPPENWIIAS